MAARTPAPLAVRLTIAVYILAFAIGASTHALDFVRHWPRPYRGVPWPVELFWSALLPLDLAVVALLAGGRRRAGLGLAVAVMVADVAINTVFSAAFGLSSLAWKLQLQTLFAGFVLGSVGFLWTNRRRVR